MINNAWVALLAGLITSPHCLLMCGPLAYVVLSHSKPTEHTSPVKPLLFYHLGRLISFTLLGTLAGLLGRGLLDYWELPSIKILPWTLVLFLAIFGIGLDRLIPKLPFAKLFFAKLSLKLNQFPTQLAALLLGLATPLLPCGPLYMVAWVALASGSSLFGAQIMAAFSLGTLPLFILTQSQLPRLERLFSPKIIHRTQRILALAVAVFISFRLIQAESSHTPMNTNCCHCSKNLVIDTQD